VTRSCHDAFPADGFAATWATWDGEHDEQVTLRWENEAWTAAGVVGQAQVEYVVRLSPLWQTRQFLLFRDLPEPDLWLGHDGRGHWGEMNGAHRRELDGAVDLAVSNGSRPASAFVHAVPIRRLPVDVGGSFDTRVVEVDVETLGIGSVLRTYRRLDHDAWEVSQDGDVVELNVDRFGLPTDVVGGFRRTA